MLLGIAKQVKNSEYKYVRLKEKEATEPTKLVFEIVPNLYFKITIGLEILHTW